MKGGGHVPPLACSMFSVKRNPAHIHRGTGRGIRINTTRMFPLLALVTIGLVVVACMSVATTDVKPTVVPAPSAGSASSTPVTTATATPTGAAAPAAAEIDCMGACHEPDVNDLLGAGAKPQPPSHKEYTTCLACHTTLTKPALPATHAGRLDAACTVCHLAQ